MGTLRIWLFGTLRLDHEDLSVGSNMSRSVEGLFAYLLLHRDRYHSRESLAGIFWGDRENRQARRCLNTALWRLRCVLEPNDNTRGTYLTTTLNGKLGFNCNSNYWLDVDVFEKRTRQALSCPRDEMEQLDIECLQESIRLCSGELLEGFYDDWVLRERERLRLLHLRCLRQLMYAFRSQGAYHESLACAQQILDCDPLREGIHREVMRLYCDMGERVLALRQYQHCREILADELGIVPMEETQALHHRIAVNGQSGLEQPVQFAERAYLLQAVRQLKQAIDESALAQKRLRDASVQLERWIPHAMDDTYLSEDRRVSENYHNNDDCDSTVIAQRPHIDRDVR